MKSAAPISIQAVTPAHAARFWARVKKTDGCWIWTGCRNTRGYGRIYVRGSRLPAHRLSFVLAGKELPTDRHVCHHCRYSVNSANPKLPKFNATWGTTWNRSSKKWQALFTIRGKNHYIGVFPDRAEAAKAAKSARIALNQSQKP